jgi:UPF0755 protein
MITKIVGGILLVIAIAIGWGWRSYQTAITQPIVTHKTFIKIDKGDSISKIISKLQNQQIQVDATWFKVLAYQQDVDKKLKVGEYELKANLTAPQILALFIQGKTRQYSITFPEGWTFKQIKQKISQHPDLKHTLDSMNDEEIMEKLKADKNYPEGLFFPDTYYFARNASDFSILKKSYQKMQQVLDEEWQHKAQDLAVQDKYQALILASIVEKETAAPQERPLIAGVFTQRLKIGMMLQTDPTVIYGMGDSYRGNITRQDLHTPTPYNTYTIKGLPPTPIAMPGKEAIQAALHPTKTDKLYFVAHGHDGTHVFSATLKAHNDAVQQYIRNTK